MKIHITTIFLLLTLISCGQDKTEDTESSDKYDVSSKEKIVKALSKIDGREYDERDVCEKRSKSFDNLVLVGFFAYDRGCAGDKAFYKGRFIDPKAKASEILIEHDWKNNKEKLAIAFTKEVLVAWESVLGKYDVKKDSNTFHVPQSKILDNGGVEVICWVREPSGMQPVNDYYRLKVNFDKKGSVLVSEHIGSKSIPMKREQPEIKKEPVKEEKNQ